MIQLTASQRDHYWNRVRDALKLAGAPTELAESLMLEVDRLPADQQELFYHAEPLDVARDLSGVQRWSDEQVHAYVEQSRRESIVNKVLAVSRDTEQTRLYKAKMVRAALKSLELGETSPQELFRLIGKMEAEKRLTKLGLMIAEFVGLAGLVVSIALAVTGLIAVIPAIIFSTLTSIITLLLFTLSPGRTISKSSK